MRLKGSRAQANLDQDGDKINERNSQGTLDSCGRQVAKTRSQNVFKAIRKLDPDPSAGARTIGLLFRPYREQGNDDPPWVPAMQLNHIHS